MSFNPAFSLRPSTFSLFSRQPLFMQIGFFSMQADIQSLHFILRSRPQRRNHTDRFEDDETDHSAVNDDGSDCRRLNDQLFGIAVQGAIGYAVPALRGKDSG